MEKYYKTPKFLLCCMFFGYSYIGVTMKLRLKLLFCLVLFSVIMVSYTYANEIREKNESDTSFKRQVVYVELGGQGIGLSINADYRFHPNLTFRAGLSYLIFGYGIPLSLNYITGKNFAHHLELGARITFANATSLFSSKSDEKIIPTAIFGYRY